LFLSQKWSWVVYRWLHAPFFLLPHALEFSALEKSLDLGLAPWVGLEDISADYLILQA
jgi:hypothetical protein